VSARDKRQSAFRLTRRCPCIVLTCTDMREADEVGRQLLELNNGCLVTYRRAEDLMSNAPAGRVALVILATSDSPEVICRTLKWLRRRWPRVPITVVGDVGGGELELAARKEAACYLTRPVDAQQWRAILGHALGAAVPQRVDNR